MLEPILVTGATGFVGKAITGLLRSKGFKVVTHARRSAPGVDWAADLGDPTIVARHVPSNVFAVVHCAAAIPARSTTFARDNALATTNLADVIADIRSLRRVVHISSVAVYKRPFRGRWTISEEAEIVDVSDSGADFYARSKIASESALDDLGLRRSGIKVTHLRASSIYGPGMVPTTLLPTFVACAVKHEPLRLRGPRRYAQNFVHVSDVADLTAALIREDEAPPIINVFSDDTYALPALAELVRVGLDSHSIIVDDTNDADSPEPVYINSQAKRFHPAFRRLIEHLRHAA